MEMTNGIVAGSDNGANSGLTSTQGMADTSSSAPASEISTQVETRSERTFRQHEVNEIVKKAKNDAFASYTRMQNEQPDYFSGKSGSNQPSSQQSSQHNFSSEENIRRIAAEEAQRLSEQYSQNIRSKQEAEDAERIVKSFVDKVSPAKAKYSDFDTVTADLGMQRFPNSIQLLASHVDNSGDILYELAKDRAKLVDIERDCREGFTDVAIQKLKRLSQSIKDNELASKVRLPNEPLSQLQQTNMGTSHGSQLSVSDYRTKYKKMR